MLFGKLHPQKWVDKFEVGIDVYVTEATTLRTCVNSPLMLLSGSSWQWRKLVLQRHRERFKICLLIIFFTLILQLVPSRSFLSDCTAALVPHVCVNRASARRIYRFAGFLSACKIRQSITSIAIGALFGKEVVTRHQALWELISKHITSAVHGRLVYAGCATPVAGECKRLVVKNSVRRTVYVSRKG